MSGWPVAAQREAWLHLDTQVLAAPAATITFSGIAAAAAPRLRVYMYGIKDGTNGDPLFRFNGDSGGNYDHQNIQASGAAVTSARATAQTSIKTPFAGYVADEPALTMMTIGKPVAGEVGRATLLHARGGTVVLYGVAGEWTNTGALINRVDVVSSAASWIAGTRTVLEGTQ